MAIPSYPYGGSALVIWWDSGNPAPHDGTVIARDQSAEQTLQLFPGNPLRTS
jgi:hypothetical protein